MAHKHPPYRPDDPRYAAWPDCPYRTKKECGQALSAWKAEARAREAERKQAAVAAQKAAREVAYLEYEESERERIAAVTA